MRIDDKGHIWIDMPLPIPDCVPKEEQGLLNCSRGTREINLTLNMARSLHHSLAEAFRVAMDAHLFSNFPPSPKEAKQ